MADHSINFKVGFAFAGEGTTKVTNAVKSMTGHIQKGMAAATMTASALNQLDGAAGRAATAINGIVQAIATGSPIMVAFAAGMTAVNYAISKAAKESEAAIDRLNDLAELAKQKTLANIAGDIDAVNAQVATTVKRFDAITKQANDFAAALNGLKNADAQGSVIQLHVERFNAVINAETDEIAELVGLEYDLKLAKEKERNAIDGATNSVKVAKNAYDANAAKLAIIRNSQAKANEAIARASRVFDVVAQGYQKGSAEYDAALKELTECKRTVAALDDEEAALRGNSKTLLVKLQTAEQTLANVTDEQTLAVAQANQRITDATKKVWTGSCDLAEFIEGVERDTRESLATAEKEFTDTTTAAERARAAVTAAENNLKSAIEKYNRNINQNLVTAGITGGTFKYSDDYKARQDAAAAVAAEQGLANGSIHNSQQLNDVRKSAARAQRDYESSKDVAQQKRDQRDYERLSKMNPRAMSNYDKNRLKDLEDIRKANAKEANEKAKAEAELAKAKEDAAKLAEAQRKAYEDVKAIKDKLEALGLK